MEKITELKIHNLIVSSRTDISHPLSRFLSLGGQSSTIVSDSHSLFFYLRDIDPGVTTLLDPNSLKGVPGIARLTTKIRRDFPKAPVGILVDWFDPKSSIVELTPYGTLLSSTPSPRTFEILRNLRKYHRNS